MTSPPLSPAKIPAGKDETKGLFGDVLVVQQFMVCETLVAGHLLRVCNQLLFSFKNSNGLSTYVRVTQLFCAGGQTTTAQSQINVYAQCVQKKGRRGSRC